MKTTVRNLVRVLVCFFKKIDALSFAKQPEQAFFRRCRSIRCPLQKTLYCFYGRIVGNLQSAVGQ